MLGLILMISLIVSGFRSRSIQPRAIGLIFAIGIVATPLNSYMRSEGMKNLGEDGSFLMRPEVLAANFALGVAGYLIVYFLAFAIGWLFRRFKGRHHKPPFRASSASTNITDSRPSEADKTSDLPRHRS